MAEQKRAEEIAAEIRADLGSMVEVMLPGDAEEPVLQTSVRRAVFEWMTETRAIDDLKSVGLQPRMSCLLYGPPGCGKTTLAHHFAARLGMPLVIVNTETMVSSYIGATGQNIGRLFACLRKHRKSAIGFLDEIDSIATKRSNDGQAAAKEQNAIVTALLTNIEKLNGTFFAATNLHDAIDPAIWRRFSMHIDVRLPEFDERYSIIKRYAAPFELDDSLLDELAMATNGAAPSLLRQLMEGIKRTLALAPRLKRDVSDCAGVLRQVVSQVQPHPAYLSPPHIVPRLWADSAWESAFESMPWPPHKPECASGQKTPEPAEES